MTRDYIQLNPEALQDILFSIVASPVLLINIPESLASLPLGDYFRKEIYMLTGSFHHDSPQLDAVHEFLNAHDKELLNYIRKIKKEQELTAEDLAFFQGFVAPNGAVQ